MPHYVVILDMEVTEEQAARVSKGTYGPTNADRLAGWFANDAVPYIEGSVKLLKVQPDGTHLEIPIQKRPEGHYYPMYP